MNSSYEESSSSDEEEEHKYRRHGKSSEDEDEDEEEESSSDSDDEEEDEEEDSDDSTSSEELKRRAKKKNKDKGKEKGKETLGRTAMKRAAMEEGERVGSIPHAADTSPSIARAVMSPRLSGGSSGGGIDRTSSGNIRQRPPLTDSTAVLVRGMRAGGMTDEERERELEREKEKAQRKEERKKAIKNLDTIISSLQELEDLPHVDQNGRRDSSGPRSGGYTDSRERWHNTNSARNVDSSHHESFSSASTERKGDGEEKERTNSRGNGDDGSKSGGGGQRNSNDKENSSSRETNNSKGKEKEGSKKGGLVRLSIFHKRTPKDKEKPARKDSKKKPTKKAGESEQGEAGEENGYIKVEKKNKKKDATFNKLYQVQTLGEQEGGHYGAIWVMQFSPDGRYLATAGSDGVLRVWRVDPKFATDEGKQGRLTQLLDPVCYKSFPGHTLDILCISWSNNEFLLSSSMDCTVRLWHMSCDDCVSCFEHKDFVTTVAFHPINNKVFMSGGLDKRIYVWNIPRKRIAFQVEIGDMITAGAFVSDKGEYLVVGTDTGKLLLCETEEAITKEPTSPDAEGSTSPRPTIEMKVAKEMHVHNSRFKARDHIRRKVTGIEASKDGKHMLVSSNDSSARLYRTKDFSLICKYAGYTSREFQVKATLSPDGKYVVAGSEDQNVFLWEAGKEKRNKACEFFQVTDEEEGMATAASFAPAFEGVHGQVVVAASLDGELHVYHNEQPEES